MQVALSQARFWMHTIQLSQTQRGANRIMEPTRSSTITHRGTPPAHKITQAFERARQEGRGVLIPYFMCGYPSAEQSVRLTLAAIEGGADIIELGIPFSDPLADGVTIQHAGQIALQNDITLRECLHIAHQ